MQERWSGEIDWQYVSYEVPAGVHVFEWRYDKSPNVVGGQDRCWVDDIVFPSNSLVLAVESFTEKKNLDIYPNPASDVVYVNLTEPFNVTIYNYQGQLVKNVYVDGTVHYTS